MNYLVALGSVTATARNMTSGGATELAVLKAEVGHADRLLGEVQACPTCSKKWSDLQP